MEQIFALFAVEDLTGMSVQTTICSGLLALFFMWKLLAVIRLYERYAKLNGTVGEEYLHQQQNSSRDHVDLSETTFSPGRLREVEDQLGRIQSALSLGYTQEIKLRSKLARATHFHRQQRALNKEFLNNGKLLAADCEEELTQAQNTIAELQEQKTQSLYATARLESYTVKLQAKVDEQALLHTRTATQVKDDAEITEAVVRDCLESNHHEALMLLRLRDELIESNTYLAEQIDDLKKEAETLGEMIFEEEVAATATTNKLKDQSPRIKTLQSFEEIRAVRELLKENSSESLMKAMEMLGFDNDDEELATTELVHRSKRGRDFEQQLQDVDVQEEQEDDEASTPSELSAEQELVEVEVATAATDEREDVVAVVEEDLVVNTPLLDNNRQHSSATKGGATPLTAQSPNVYNTNKNSFSHFSSRKNTSSSSAAPVPPVVAEGSPIISV